MLALVILSLMLATAAAMTGEECTEILKQQMKAETFRANLWMIIGTTMFVVALVSICSCTYFTEKAERLEKKLKKLEPAKV